MAIEVISNEVWLAFRLKPTIETRNFILMNYIQLVKEIASRLAPVYKNYFEYDDLFSCGIFGMMDAIEKFDVCKGIKFETYATWRIRGAMIDHIREQDWLPKSMRQKFKNIEETYKNIEKNLGRYPTDAEVARHLDISIDELNKILQESYYYQVISMDEQIMDVMKIDDTKGDQIPENAYIKEELRHTLGKVIDQLTENERMVTSLYYFDELNQKEIGKVMGLTESRISQLHSKALIKLRSSIEKLNLVEI